MNLTELLDNAIKYHQDGDLTKAQKLYNKIIKQDNQNADVWHLLGLIDYQKNKISESIEKIKRAISIYPYSAIFYSNIGLGYLSCGLVQKGYESFKKAIELNPNYPEAFNNLGNALSAKGLVSESIKQYKKAIELNPNYPEALYNLGNAFYLLDKFNEALKYYKEAVKINPQYANGYAGIALLMKKNKRFKEAKGYFDIAFSKSGLTNRYALSGLYETKREICDWDGIDKLEDELIKSAQSSSPLSAIIEPFTASQILKTDLKQQKELIEIYVRSHIEPKIINDNFDTKFSKMEKHARIKIAYISPNFYNQASMHLVNGLFGKHNKELFEVYIYAYHYDENSPYYKNAKKDVEHFVDLKGFEAVDIVNKIRDNNIDILIDLRSHGYRSKAQITASRVAPVQISFVNFPATTGNKGVDYIVVDKTLVLEDELDCYSEQPLFMPNCYISTDDKQPISENPPTKKECGLPEESFVFCNFNTLYKIESDIFKIWMVILKKVENSVLWLLKSDEDGANNLKKEALIHDVNPQRLIFADIIEKPDHLARLQLADLFLDTLYCNAHTSAIDCLWGGLPLITVPGNTYTARAASSILKGMGMDELICNDIEKYITKAIYFSSNLDKLEQLKNKLNKNKKTKSLFNTQQYVNNLEKAYTIMYKRFYNKEMPSPIYL